jgi:hypothetical protein
MKRKLAISFIIIIFLLSCSDVSDFLFETDQNIQVRSVNNGSVYQGGDSFPLTIFHDREITPDSFSVSIFDSHGISWGETVVEIPASEGEYITSLIIPDELPQGKYIFHIRVFESSREIAFREVILFKTDKEYAIEQLFSLPHETEAGKDVLIQAEVQSPDGTDPFLRWTLDGQVLKEGFLSLGLETLHWLSGEENGLYVIQLEVFPEYCDSSYTSSVKSSIEIVVNDLAILNAHNLSPDRDYSLLFHFAGDFESSGTSDLAIEKNGSLKFHSVGDSLGYVFSEESGLKVSGRILPVASGEITPFSISGRVAFGESFSGGDLLIVNSGIDSVLSLAVDDLGYLFCTINETESKSLFPIHKVTDFTVSFIPGDKGLTVRWFYDGFYGGSDFLNTEFVYAEVYQTALLGGHEGNPGANVFIDELGVYIGKNRQSAVDAEQFRRNRKYHLGTNLIDAKGYDGADDGVSLEEGNLLVKPGQRILLSRFYKSIKDTEFILSFPDRPASGTDSWKIILTGSDGELLATITENNLIRDTDAVTGHLTEKIRFSLKTEEKNIKLVVEGNESPDQVLSGIFPGDLLSLFFETNVENKNSSFVDSFVIFTKIKTLKPEMAVSPQVEEKLL